MLFSFIVVAFVIIALLHKRRLRSNQKLNVLGRLLIYIYELMNQGCKFDYNGFTGNNA